jgi:hypothetical protein
MDVGHKVGGERLVERVRVSDVVREHNVFAHVAVMHDRDVCRDDCAGYLQAGLGHFKATQSHHRSKVSSHMQERAARPAAKVHEVVDGEWIELEDA